MSYPVSQPTYPGGTGHGIAYKPVTVVSVNTETRIAVTRDSFGKYDNVRCDIMRAKGNLPAPREQWLIDRQYGDWVFGAIITGGTEGVIIPQDNVTGLNEAQASTDERIVGIQNGTLGQIQGKGDILVGTQSGIATAQPAGGSGQYLCADPTKAAGLDYREGLALSAPLDGARAAGRYVGNTVSGQPSFGTFLAGDWVRDAAGYDWICTSGGTPGTWESKDYTAEQPGKHIWRYTGGSVAANVPVMATGFNNLTHAGIALRSGGTFSWRKTGRWAIHAMVESDCPDAGVFHSFFQFGSPNPVGIENTILRDRRYRPGNGAFTITTQVWNGLTPGANVPTPVTGTTGFPGAGAMTQSLSWAGWIYPQEALGAFSLNFYWACPSPTAPVTCDYRVGMEYLGPY
jgi:hypothetical protein